MQNRFIDSGESLRGFMGQILVVCPECEAAAKIVDGKYRCSTCSFQPKPLLILTPRCGRCTQPLRKSVCSGCGHYNAGIYQRPTSWVFHELKSVELGLDPYFGLDLLLRANYRGKVLWFYNLSHLEYIESYLQASIRERIKLTGNASLISRLPAWIKDRKSTNDLLKKIVSIKRVLA